MERHLATAVAVDGHNWIYPVAYGFIPSESEDHWKLFMEQLKKAIGNLPLLAVCSDACKGLMNAVKKVFPNAEQRECFFHLTKNFMKKFRGSGNLSHAARAYSENIFYEHIASIISENAKAVQQLQKIITCYGTGVVLIQKFNVTMKDRNSQPERGGVNESR
jgi:hypothetical protein